MNTISKNTISKMQVMQGFLDGKKIRFRPLSPGDEWAVYPFDGEPTWDWDTCEYEIMPEPKVIYVNEFKDGSMLPYTSKEEALKGVRPNVIRGAVKYVEAIED